MAHLRPTEPQALAQTQEMIPAQEREMMPAQEREMMAAHTRAFRLWLPTISRELTSLLVGAVTFHGRSLGLEVTVVEVQDLWLTLAEVVATGDANAVGQFQTRRTARLRPPRHGECRRYRPAFRAAAVRRGVRQLARATVGGNV